MGFSRGESGFSLLSNSETETETDMTKDLLFHRNLRDFQKKMKQLQIFAVVLGILTLLSLAFSIALWHGSSKSKRTPIVPSSALIPQFPRRPVTFEENSIYSEAPSNRSDEAWHHLIPQGRGYIYVHNPEKYYLHQGLANTRNDNSQSYVISMYHQLHCLDILRIGYYAALENKTTPHTHGKHLTHCFDYLRQAIMCSGDTTLEWPRVEHDGSRVGADGWGVTHECVDYDRMFMWTEERRGDDRASIL